MLPVRGVADRRCSWCGIGSNSWGLWQAHCRCCSHGRTHGAWMHACVLCRLLCGTCASPFLGEQQRWRSLRAVLRWGSALVRGLHRRGDAYGCSTRCATSLTICSNAPLATVYFYSSRRDLLEIQCAASRCSGGVLPLTTRCCWVLGCVMRQAHIMLPGLMRSGEFGVCCSWCCSVAFVVLPQGRCVSFALQHIRCGVRPG